MIRPKEISVQYLIPDKEPKEGLKPIKYYINDGEIGYFYLGLNNQVKYDRQTLEDFASEGKLIRLPETVKLTEKEDLYFNAEGDIVKVSGYGASQIKEKILSIII